MQHWYVYYKVAATESEMAVACARRIFEALPVNEPPARLLRRIDGDVELTLMEVYGPISDAARFEDMLQQAVARSGLPAALLARRRVERFEDI
ncbi:MAG: DUF4936 family protein [Sutterellaceae bacterium]|nr:DUF4936 family protein [Burkholderiaceae bacterium]MCX7902410.1 DUF4936 family protein [Burkholderiaceae bacterium]MDW8431035.1 DUF4936 family protein [Sutterellaceae bacterium]